ncbi:MAG: biotin/lipoyl-binding protein, partial [Bacteroidota bacterium]
MKNRKNKDKKEDKMEVVRRGEFIVKIRESGNLEPLVSVEVRSNVEGDINNLYIKEGDVVKKGQKLLQIDAHQIEEQKKQAEANRDARQAQLAQAKLRIQLTQKQQESAITQAQNAVKVAKASLESLDATTIQRVTQAETDIATTKNAVEQDRIALSQAEISLQQAKLTLEQYQGAEKSAKIARDNAESEYKRNKDLFEKKFVSKKILEDAESRLATATSQYETSQTNVQSQSKAVEFQKQNIAARQQAIETRQTTLRFQEQNLISIKESQGAQMKQLLAELGNAEARLQEFMETTNQEKLLTVHSEVGAQAGLLEAQSQLKSQAERLDWTTVIAPMSGTVTRLDIEEGE